MIVTGLRCIITPVSLVGCGEARTASMQALGFNIDYGQSEALHSIFDKRSIQHNLID
jgi:hypothetical protein